MKLVDVNYYDPRQKELISGRVLDGDAVKFWSKVLGKKIFLVKDEERKLRLCTQLKIEPKLVYLPLELTKIKDYGPEELRKYHEEKR